MAIVPFHGWRPTQGTEAVSDWYEFEVRLDDRPTPLYRAYVTIPGPEPQLPPDLLDADYTGHTLSVWWRHAGRGWTLLGSW